VRQPMVGSAATLLIATSNPGKFRELASLMSGSLFSLVSLSDVGIETDVPETGSTLEENAALKAAIYARLSGMLTLADDSGLEVEALGGEPGHLSARFAGEGATDAQLIAYLLQRLNNIPENEWSARFRCVLAVAGPEKPVELYSGECHGRIVSKSRGVNGFGYDPVFFLPELGRTMAELSSAEKNRVSHRSRAAVKAVAALNRPAAMRGDA